MSLSPLRFDSLLRAHRCALALLLLGLGAQAGCHGSAGPGQATPLLALTSSSIQAGEIPQKYTCDGTDASPELAWSGAPAGTQSFTLIAIDMDAPIGQFVHWVIYDLPAGVRELPEALPAQEQFADGSRQGTNDFGRIGYGGPCPPGSSRHRYVFRLYALDRKLNLPAGATRSQAEEAMKGHILAHGELIGRYQR